MKLTGNFSELLENLDNIGLTISKTSLSSIEKDIILEKIRIVYENIILKGNSTEGPNNITKSIIQEPVEIADEIVVSTPIDIIPEPEPQPEPVKEIEEIITDNEPVITPEPVITENIPPVEPLVEMKTDEPIIVNNEKSTLSDKYITNSASTLGEMLTKLKAHNDVTSRLKMMPITNLKTAISINDRIMFSRELFGNNSELYHSTIDEINKLEQLEQAMDLLSGKIDFEKPSESIEKFMEILYRRFLTTDTSLK
ncbi:MAG: hypothetical protein CVU05_09935 [Bacteroidetes bacterium HGW-Bacteroidetes-21]|jgi:hypothetical protein|nr:MAG: hypothetical protein CVU05_09935 [Bacteroidetes bacterium HGW-Bacteroidetes-21]